MCKPCLLALSLFAASTALVLGDVLIVADEFPAMEVLAARLLREENITSRLVSQTNLPADLKPYSAVVVYVHKDLKEPAEKALIDYAQKGGKLVALHHSISSGKRKNKQWFPFLGVALPEGDVNQGGYKWTEGVTLVLVNLAPDHYITTHKINYPERLAYKADGSGGSEQDQPAFTLHDSEVYLNHVLEGPRTLLLGLKYTDAKTAKTYMQSHAGWVKAVGKGWLVYLLPGHSVRDFENPVYGRVVVNAVAWKPSETNPVR